MASIFSDTASPNFWETTSSDNICHDPLFSSALQYFSKSKLKTKIFFLYAYQLVSKNPNNSQVKFSDISFKTLKPFTEGLKTCLKFGFQLNEKTFYTKSEEELRNWVLFLRPMCILNDIDFDYVFIKSIGNGSSGEVFLAEDLNNHKQVAVKCINKKKIQKFIRFVNIVKNEINALRELDSPKIVKLFEVFESSEFVYLVMEYLPKGDLCNHIRVLHKFTESNAKIFIKHLLETLDYMHSVCIVHRDLKLENLILEDDGSFKIIDFGLSFRCGFPESFKCGSPGYMAPEVLTSDSYDSKIDIFSAGVILYILLTGKHPFQGKTTQDIIENSISSRYSKKNIGCLPGSMIQLMLDPRPEFRPSARALLNHPWISETKHKSSSLHTSLDI